MPEIILNQNIKGPYYKIVIEAAAIARQAKPGQFLQIKVNNATDPLLRRPLSIHRIEKNKVFMLYEVVGCGTEILSQRKAGEDLDVLGPLGNGFNYSGVRHQTILIAGGIGGAPLVYLAQKLRKSQVRSHPSISLGAGKSQVVVLIGANTKDRILCKEEFESLGCEVKIATDDGSLGFKGRVTDLLKNVLPVTCDHGLVTIYACGPEPMLKGIKDVIAGKDIPCQVSLDENMACGFGACLGCVVKTKQGYKRVCKDGPVFEIEEVI